ncbi:MAG: hydrogenase maturation nickel metallochaperone HypA [Nitrospirae bacterium]|nr:MAG: hydrogenase maturation nickel metallochaperone HypA [Nitrospirota bacterium]
MHEASIALAIIETLEEECKKHNCHILKKVKLRIGKATGVMTDALLFAFEASKPGTVAERAVLEIEEVPLRGFCNSCNIEFESSDGVFLLCPQCESAWVKCVSGRELEIIELEMEEQEDEGKGSPKHT